MKLHYLTLVIAALVGMSVTVSGVTQVTPLAKTPIKLKNITDAGLAEARLIEVYQLMATARASDALSKAESLVKDYPNFQLAQLVYGDLLTAKTRPIKALGDVPLPLLKTAAPALEELRNESQMRMKALRERPPADAVPSQFLALSKRVKHAIAVDASRSRLYLFENRTSGLVLIADYYISIGKTGL
ncbi:MAG: L,D-transpeptidase YnhG, partial [Rhodoferax sp.]